MDKKSEIQALAGEMERCGFARMDTAGQHRFLGEWILRRYAGEIEECRCRAERERTAYYLSAEFLPGRLISANLQNVGLWDTVREAMLQTGTDEEDWESIPDHALGNGGLGRLASCFLDAAATHHIPLWGYGIRYRYGLFSQRWENGGQAEYPDNWQRMGDPWSVRRDGEAVTVMLGRRRILAVPYDMPVFGYAGENGRPGVSILRLWQAESEEPFRFDLFDAGRYAAASSPGERAGRISAVLYPNDSTAAGKELRLSQQIFFSDASVADILRRFETTHGQNWEELPRYAAIQLNDTHPVTAILSLIGRLESRGVPFARAVEYAHRIFAYTNHTVMAEALEVWDEGLLRRLAPGYHKILMRLNRMLEDELCARGIDPGEMRILADGRVHMARLAAWISHAVNGVAPLHTEILRRDVLRHWEAAYPGRIQNKTNGITQRRWLRTANPLLAEFVTDRIGDGWITDLQEIDGMRRYTDDGESRQEFLRIRQENKRRLVRDLEKSCGLTADTEMLFDVQIKRLHEYKRQLMNAFSILRLYFDLREGALPDFTPTAFLFGAKAAPGYARAKGIIRYILAISEKINSDPAVRERMRVIFVPDYNVSWAEKLIAAGDLSEQISMAGTEASGTGNMKFMLNGVPTLGTRDGANLQILEHAGEDVNFFFGPDADEMRARMAEYDPRHLYEADGRLRQVADTLIDGTFDDGGSGIFAELHGSLLAGASWHRPDNYCVLGDFAAYMEAKTRALSAYRDPHVYARMGLCNMASAGWVSADRTVREYARDIWHLT
ncbi:MAG: glycogen/starch/alpha-glucan family phosphorylase [Clostridia bacterium]|nr:glycogen/starch/alpha-glucan family phosphorylase [Clostridia bacterium]